jgi:hypothetical protein
MPMPNYTGGAATNPYGSPASDALGLGDQLKAQRMNETDEEKRRRMIEEQQRRMVGPLGQMSAAGSALFGGPRMPVR